MRMATKSLDVDMRFISPNDLVASFGYVAGEHATATSEDQAASAKVFRAGLKLKAGKVAA